MATLQSYKRILIFGAGAVGGYFGSQLTLAGYNTEFIARGARLAAFRENGLTLSDDTGQTRRIKIKVNEKPDGLYDLIIISVKAKDTQNAAESCHGHLTPGGAVLSLQNGVNNLSVLEAVFGSDAVVGGVVNSGLSVPEPGHIHYRPDPKISLGGVNEISKKHEQPLHTLFVSAGVSCTVSEDIRRSAWLKLLWNAAFNPLSAITHATCGALADSPHAMNLMNAIASEVAAVAEANGVHIPPDAVQKTLTIREGFHSYKTSALQDVEANRPPETEELLRPILEAEATGTNYPVTRTIAELSAFMFKRWFHTYPRLAADVIVVNNESVLLIERKYPPYGWAIPGGMAELGETVEHTASRELHEETGIFIPEEKLTLLGVYSDPARDTRGHTVGVVYYAFSGQSPVAADDAANARYFPFDQLPELAFDHAKVLNDLITRLKSL